MIDEINIVNKVKSSFSNQIERVKEGEVKIKDLNELFEKVKEDIHSKLKQKEEFEFEITKAIKKEENEQIKQKEEIVKSVI